MLSYIVVTLGSITSSWILGHSAEVKDGSITKRKDEKMYTEGELAILDPNINHLGSLLRFSHYWRWLA